MSTRDRAFARADRRSRRWSACGPHPSTVGPAGPSEGGPLDAGLALVPTDGAAPSSVAAVADAIRTERWGDALVLLDSLGPADHDRTDIRYARGRTLLALRRFPEAITAFDDLETSLPLLGADIGRRRADAELEAGPYDKAGEYFAAQPTALGQLTASRAFEKAGDSARAVSSCDRVIQTDKRTRAQEAEARDRRVRLGTRDVAAMVADARWLAVHAPDLESGLRADATLKRLEPASPLTAEERMKRAQVLSDAGKYSEALAVLSDVGGAPGKAVPDLERQRARAYVLYKSRAHYLEAAVALSSCAQAGGEHAAEDAFHAARSLSRADRDESAQVAYRTVAQKYGGTSWAAEASFLAARIDLLHGRWEAAARGFDQHLQGVQIRKRTRGALRPRALAPPRRALQGRPPPLRAARRRRGGRARRRPRGDHGRARRLQGRGEDRRPSPAGPTWPARTRSPGRRWSSRARLPADRRAGPAGSHRRFAGRRRGRASRSSPPLPPPVDTLHLLGFDDDAEEAL